MKYYRFPIYVIVGVNEPFFANIQWYLYKYFHIKRDRPCGRNKKDSYLCCRQLVLPERMRLSEDGKECFCKVCGSKRISSNQQIDLKEWINF